MQELVKVVVDAMGGDNAPQETVKGAVDAVNTRKDIKVILTGRQELVEGELSKYTYPKDVYKRQPQRARKNSLPFIRNITKWPDTSRPR